MTQSPFVEAAFSNAHSRWSPELYNIVVFGVQKIRWSGIATRVTSLDFPVNLAETVGGSGE